MKNLNIYKVLHKTGIIKEKKVYAKKEDRIINFKNSRIIEIRKQLNSLKLSNEVRYAYLNLLNRFLEKETFEYLVYCYNDSNYIYQLSLEYDGNDIILKVTYVDKNKCDKTEVILDDQSTIANLFFDSCCKYNEDTKPISELSSKII